MVTRIGPKHPTRLYLKEWRVERGLSQEQLAERMGTTKTSISRYENQRRDVTLGFLEAIVEALGGHLEVPDLFRLPTAPSIDASLRRASPKAREQVYAVVETILRTASK